MQNLKSVPPTENSTTDHVKAIEQITWFSNRIVFEVFSEGDDEDIVEWERTLSRTEDGDFNQTHYNDNVRLMHNMAYKLATAPNARTEHRERRLRRKRMQMTGT